MKQYDELNLTMVMDLYELTIANGYFIDKDNTQRVAFDVFYRRNPDNGGYAIFAGLQQIIEYIEDLHFDDDDISYLRSLNLFGEEFPLARERVEKVAFTKRAAGGTTLAGGRFA